MENAGATANQKARIGGFKPGRIYQLVYNRGAAFHGGAARNGGPSGDSTGLSGRGPSVGWFAPGRRRQTTDLRQSRMSGRLIPEHAAGAACTVDEDGPKAGAPTGAFHSCRRRRHKGGLRLSLAMPTPAHCGNARGTKSYSDRFFPCSRRTPVPVDPWAAREGSVLDGAGGAAARSVSCRNVLRQPTRRNTGKPRRGPLISKLNRKRCGAGDCQRRRSAILFPQRRRRSIVHFGWVSELGNGGMFAKNCVNTLKPLWVLRGDRMVGAF